MLYSRTGFRILTTITAIGWLILCQIIFYVIQTHYAEKITLSLENQFRSEFYSDNYQKLSNMVADITRSDFIRCSKLTRLDQQRVIIDFTSIQDGCNSLHNFLTLSHVNKDLVVKSLSGTEYALSFQITNTSYFVIALWLMRLIGLILIFLVSLIFIINEKRKIIEFNKMQEITDAKELISLKLAHDIRSPLSVLNLITARLQSPEPEINDLFAQAINRINDIANDLLSPTTKKKTLDINKTILEIVSEKQTLFKTSAIKFRLELDESQIICAMDSSELSRILSNLLNNAIEAIEKSAPASKLIEITTTKNDYQCFVKIKDNGCGIPDSHLKILGTQRFTHGKENSKAAGSGIGLYGANEYLKQNNGKLEVTSVLNKFTEITLTLPLVKK